LWKTNTRAARFVLAKNQIKDGAANNGRCGKITELL